MKTTQRDYDNEAFMNVRIHFERSEKLKNAVPGEVVELNQFERFESSMSDKEFHIGPQKLYCLCVGRTEQTTASGLTLLKVFVLTPAGIGYKRYNVGGDNKNAPVPTRTWV